MRSLCVVAVLLAAVAVSCSYSTLVHYDTNDHELIVLDLGFRDYYRKLDGIGYWLMVSSAKPSSVLIKLVVRNYTHDMLLYDASQFAVSEGGIPFPDCSVIDGSFSKVKDSVYTIPRGEEVRIVYLVADDARKESADEVSVTIGTVRTVDGQAIDVDSVVFRRRVAPPGAH